MDKVKHGNKNFFQHLVGTYNILKKWKQPEEVCLAGLFHNIYGNNFFKSGISIQRKEIINLIGKESENLVFEFTHLNREEILKENNLNLLSIFSANNLEQEIFIKKIDNFIEKEENDKLCAFFSNLKYSFEGRNNTNLSKKFIKYLKEDNLEEDKLKKIADNLLKKFGLFHLVDLKRAYSNLQTYGYHGEFHRDEGAKELNEVFTVMFYLTNEWNADYAGETVFINDFGDIIFSILPQPMRAVVFDGYYLHAPRPLSKICHVPRIVVTFKYMVK